MVYRSNIQRDKVNRIIGITKNFDNIGATGNEKIKAESNVIETTIAQV